MDKGAKKMESKLFQPTWESLRKYECPEWFQNAKFGIWAHWGAASVPMYGDWYARKMYEEGSDAYYHHWKVYGHPSKNGYKDIIPLWKAEDFDPDALLAFYKKCGARYFMALAVHHDNFDNWDSKWHKWNSVNMGPHKDIIAMWKKAADKYGLKFAVSEHLGASQLWWMGNKSADKEGVYKGVPYDANNPEYWDLYQPPVEDPENPFCYSRDRKVEEDWYRRLIDLLDHYEPDMLYTDGPFPYGKSGLKLVSHLYNLKAKDGKTQAVYTQKDTRAEYEIGVLDVERSGLGSISSRPWQTDTCLGDWFYDVKARYKSARQVIDMLVHCVSKNGNLMLSVPLKPSGVLDDECKLILEQIGKWLEKNGEAIYESRPWKRFGEGDTLRFFSPLNEKQLSWSAQDFHFTRKKDAVYVFQMGIPVSGNTILVESLAASEDNPVGKMKVSHVQELGTGEEICFKQTEKGLLLTMPKEWMNGYPIVYKVW